MSRKKFSELRAKMSPEAQERVRERTEEMLAEMQPSPAGEGAQETLHVTERDYCPACRRHYLRDEEVAQIVDKFARGRFRSRVIAALRPTPALPSERAALVEQLEKEARIVREQRVGPAYAALLSELLLAAAAALRGETGAE